MRSVLLSFWRRMTRPRLLDITFSELGFVLVYRKTRVFVSWDDVRLVVGRLLGGVTMDVTALDIYSGSVSFQVAEPDPKFLEAKRAVETHLHIGGEWYGHVNSDPHSYEPLILLDRR